MTDRKEWDRPAALIALVLGLLVVAGSLPFTVLAFCAKEGCGATPPEPKEFLVIWATNHAGDRSASIGKPSEIPVLGPVARVTLSGTCVDEFDDRYQQAATFNYTLARKVSGQADEMVRSGTFTCDGGVPSGLPLVFDVEPHPELSSISALNSTEALREAKNRTAEEPTIFVLRVAASRPQTQVGGIPVPDPGVSPPRAEADLTAVFERWAAGVQEKPQEAPR